PVRERSVGSDLELDQPVILGFDGVQDLAVVRDYDPVSAVHVDGFLADRAIGCDVEDLAVDHGTWRRTGAGEVDASVMVGREVIRAHERIPILVVRVGRQILAVGRDAADRTAVVAGREKLATGGGNHRRGPAALLGPEDGALRTIPGGHGTAI